MRKLFPLFLALMTTTSLRAYDFQSGDLYYNITSDTSVEVTYQDFLSSNNYFGLTTATIPETVTYNGRNYSVTNIGNDAFCRCTGLTSVTIPNSVTCIEDYAFGDCSSLLTIICHAAEVPELVGWNIFSNIPLSDATLYIPAESLEDYKAADQWKEFGTILPLEDAPDAVENIQSPTANGTIVIRDGQLLILRDGKIYSMMGQEM